jgi:hypothetical protein
MIRSYHHPEVRHPVVFADSAVMQPSEESCPNSRDPNGHDRGVSVQSRRRPTRSGRLRNRARPIGSTFGSRTRSYGTFGAEFLTVFESSLAESLPEIGLDRRIDLAGPVTSTCITDGTLPRGGPATYGTKYYGKYGAFDQDGSCHSCLYNEPPYEQFEA